MCLDLSNSNTSNGMIIYDCDFSKSNQKWLLDDTGAFRSQVDPDKCLNWGGSLTFESCNGSSSQRTVFQSDGRITDSTGTKCLDIENNQVNLGTAVKSYNCWSWVGDNQNWTAAPNPSEYFVINARGYALDVSGDNFSWGNEVIPYSPNGQLNQAWYLTLSSDGTNYFLQSALTGYCADDSGSSVKAYPCKVTGSDNNQKWTVTRNQDNKTITFRGVSSGKCIGIYYDYYTYNSQSIGMRDCSESGTTLHYDITSFGVAAQAAGINWPSINLDSSRIESTCGGSGRINCWQYDDQYRDRLNMDASNLTYTQKIVPGGAFQRSGRFIFVYRKSDNSLVLRRYDRAHNQGAALACLDYAKYRYAPNMNNPINPAEYMHVRHSQLNGGWSAVGCAGELTISNGRILRLNNASGHFKPPASCLQNVESLFTIYGYQFNPGYQKGNYTSVATEETQCPENSAGNPGPDDQLELSDEL